MAPTRKWPMTCLHRDALYFKTIRINQLWQILRKYFDSESQKEILTLLEQTRISFAEIITIIKIPF